MIQKREGWSYCAISDNNESSSSTLNKTGNESQKEKTYCNFEHLKQGCLFQRQTQYQNGTENAECCPENSSRQEKIFMNSQNIPTDLKGSNVKYNLHCGWCTGILLTAVTRHNTSLSNNKHKITSNCSITGIT